MLNGNLLEFVRQEFRTARTNAYRSALLDQLVEHSPQILTQELQRAVSLERPGPARRYYRAVLEILAGGGIKDRWDIHRNARSLFVRFRYGG